MARTIKARLKFKYNVPIGLELALTQKYGFTFHSRKAHEWVMFVKYGEDLGSGKDINYHDLPNEVQNDLTRRCNRIYGTFVEPEKHNKVIAQRCRNMARTLEPKQREWVLAWVRRNCNVDDDGADLPWVIDAEELKAEIQGKLL